MDGMVGILRVQGLDQSLAAHLLPQAARWAENLCPAGHYGLCVVVRKHTSPSVIAPINAFHRLCEDGIMTECTAPRERAAVRSRTSVENRPFLCQLPMGQTSFYGRFGGGVGHQRWYKRAQQGQLLGEGAKTLPSPKSSSQIANKTVIRTT